MHVHRMRRAGRAAESGEFVLHNVHGPRLIKVGYTLRENVPWWPQAVVVDGVNVTTVPVDFAERPNARLEVVFTRRR